MKINVDLTEGHIFNSYRQSRRGRSWVSSKQKKVWKHEICEECNRPVSMPWRNLCRDCNKILESPRFSRIRCCYQLNYPKKIKGKINCRRQLGDPKWYALKRTCFEQLTRN